MSAILFGLFRRFPTFEQTIQQALPPFLTMITMAPGLRCNPP